MTWRVRFSEEAKSKSEKLILPDSALAGGDLIIPPDIAELARNRRELLGSLTERLAQQPYSSDLATARSTRKIGASGSVYVSTVQGDVEACHVWWSQAIGITINDIAFTPTLKGLAAV